MQQVTEEFSMINVPKEVLLHICFHEHEDRAAQFAAARELQYRYIPEDVKADVVYRIGKGESTEHVAFECGLTQFQVIDLMRQMHRTHKSATEWKTGYKKTLSAAGRRIG